jgi:hypothetical protein
LIKLDLILFEFLTASKRNVVSPRLNQEDRGQVFAGPQPTSLSGIESQDGEIKIHDMAARQRERQDNPGMKNDPGPGTGGTHLNHC